MFSSGYLNNPQICIHFAPLECGREKIMGRGNFTEDFKGKVVSSFASLNRSSESNQNLFTDPAQENIFSGLVAKALLPLTHQLPSL